jgi:endonuclease-8
MPEGDSLFRTARTLHRALAGHIVTGFESVFPHLTRVDHDRPIRGRAIAGVESRGKHLLIGFSGDLVLRTHMRMNGSWHIYRQGERWFRAHHEMRILLETARYQAVAFNVPVAELDVAAKVLGSDPVRELGPDPLAPGFDADAAVNRIRERGDVPIADVLLDQRAIAGVGNIFKSEVLFAARVNPFAPARALARTDVERIVDQAVRLMRANVGENAPGGITTYAGLRRRPTRDDPGAGRWVYGRGGRPCRRCGTPISWRRQGPQARSTYWCERCQPP